MSGNTCSICGGDIYEIPGSSESCCDTCLTVWDDMGNIIESDYTEDQDEEDRTVLEMHFPQPVRGVMGFIRNHMAGEINENDFIQA